jgi:CheY-like chemotaxis protein
MRHILLVDDDPVFLAAMAKALGLGGYRVTTADHVAPALAVLEDAENKPDALVTDLVMPQSVHGVALSRMARLRHRAIPTVYLTGYDLPDIDEQLDGPLLRKPVEPEQLIAAIEAEVARRAP